ncbi:hypothetical protein DFH09DRAFT_941466, partial [Mycena vulgaris]
LEDWTQQTDILRCNPNFHNKPWYDHVLVNHDVENLTVAHLVELLRCKVPDKSSHDIAVVNMLKRSKWVPKTKWANYRLYEERSSLQFVLFKYLVRGAHTVPAFDSNKSSLTYRNDLIDGDMFLLAGN